MRKEKKQKLEKERKMLEEMSLWQKKFSNLERKSYTRKKHLTWKKEYNPELSKDTILLWQKVHEMSDFHTVQNVAHFKKVLVMAVIICVCVCM